ncbi:MAG: hypothetical protein HQL46_14090 [Gammaproteobacteria bacterium]|nr:hypothetical protein [Gammaproteobacteria bacterium]
MPDFEIHGKGIKTGRNRKRTYTAKTIEEAKALALKDDTEVIEIIELSSTAPAKKKSSPVKKAKTTATAKKTVKNKTVKTKAAPKKATATAPKATAAKSVVSSKVLATKDSGTNKAASSQPKYVTIARSETVNSPSWTALPKSKKSQSSSIFNSSSVYLILMIAFLLYIMFYYFSC